MAKEIEHDPEDLTREAEGFFDLAEKYRGRVSLDNLGRSRLSFTSGLVTTVVLRVPILGASRSSFTQRGFSEAEMDEGVVALVQELPTFARKYATLTDGGDVRAVLDDEERTASPTELSREELIGIETVAVLSALPGRVVDKFGDAENFESYLDTKDPIKVFDLMNPSTNGIYPWGLRQHIDAVIMMRAGTMHSETSGLRSVIGSYDGTQDRSNYFETIARKAGVARRRLRLGR